MGIASEGGGTVEEYRSEDWEESGLSEVWEEKKRQRNRWGSEEKKKQMRTPLKIFNNKIYIFSWLIGWRGKEQKCQISTKQSNLNLTKNLTISGWRCSKIKSLYTLGKKWNKKHIFFFLFNKFTYILRENHYTHSETSTWSKWETQFFFSCN